MLCQADKQYEDQKKREAMAMKYWEEKKIEEQVHYSDYDYDDGGDYSYVFGFFIRRSSQMKRMTISVQDTRQR